MVNVGVGGSNWAEDLSPTAGLCRLTEIRVCVEVEQYETGPLLAGSCWSPPVATFAPFEALPTGITPLPPLLSCLIARSGVTKFGEKKLFIQYLLLYLKMIDLHIFNLNYSELK
jgi:hypothetical protein